MAGVAHAGTAPTGGQIVAGSGQIQQSGSTTTIRQNSQTLSLNWQSFDIGAGQTVQFLQPGADSIAVNRILGNTASEIDGHLKANGQVWLINPNGVLFGRDAQVNVGGLVASTLAVDDSTIGSGDVRFAGNGKGAVVNRGSITVAAGGYVALLGNDVSNQGVIRARLGTVALGAGTAVTLTFADHHLMHLQVDANTVRSLVENRQLIVADGGAVLMTAGARDSLVASAVNNSGIVQARGVEEHDGTITLLGGMRAGTVRVGGTLDASAPGGGDGGRIETSAAHFELAHDARVTAAAVAGHAGTWLVDPVDLTIDATAASTISTTLNGGTNVTEQTTATSASGEGTQSVGDGDINVNAAINWTNPAATLTLDAFHDINVNAGVSGSGGIVMQASGALTIGTGGSLQADGGATLTADTFVNSASSAALGSSWHLYTTSPAGDTLGGLAPDFIQYDATLGSTLAASGNGLIYSVAPTLHIGGLQGTVSKVYDDTSAASFTGANFNATGLLGGDQIDSASGSYASVNVGSGIAVTSPADIGGFVITNNGVPVYGYALDGASLVASIGQITPRPLTATIVGNPTKVYDGTTTATLSASNYQIDGFVAGQGATVSQPSSIAYAGSDAGSQTLNATFSVTNFTADAGTRLSNYSLPTSATGAGTITQAPLLISGLLADSKVYDGTTADDIDTSGAKLFGVIAPDAGEVGLDTSGIVGTFAQANAGSGIAVTVSGWSLTGVKASDYQIVPPTGLTANITPKTLTIGQVTAKDKTYDATRTATLDTGSAVLDGVIGTDDVALDSSAAAAEFSQADVRNGLTVTTHGFTLDGIAAGNYALTQPTLTADITPALLTISMTGTPTKTYDGTDAVTLGASNFDITGFIGTQQAVVSQSSAHYATANAGDNIDVTATLQPSDFTPDAGTSMSNYTFAPTVVGTGLGQIDPLQLTGQIVGNPTKTFDGTTDAQLSASNIELVGLLPGDSITASFSGSVAGSYVDPNAGVHEVDAGVLASTNFTAAGGTLLSNYLLPANYFGSGTITPAPLSGQVIGAGIVNASKVYDGTIAITLDGTNFVLSGFVGSDSATVGTTVAGTFGQKDVGTDIPLSATLAKSDLVAGAGTNLDNYTLANPALGVGDITARPLTVSVIGDPTKVYNGSVDAALTSANFNVSGWAASEGGSIDPSATASYDAADAGARTITAVLTPGNYVLDPGTKLSNYVVAFSATGAGTITKAPLFVTGVGATDKVYDTTTTDTLSTGSSGLAGLVDSDVGKVALDLSGVSANFSQADTGADLAVTATGFVITGSEAANYDLQPVTGLQASITPATLTLTGVSAVSKTYDGSAGASLVSAGATLDGILGSDSVSFDAGSASGLFITANAGTGLKVTASGFTLTGIDAGNYTLGQPTGLTADIDPKALTAVIIGSPTKVYDGTNSATLTASDYDLQGFVAGQGASIPQSATANYVTKNAGTGLGVESTLVTSDFVADAGTNLANYVLPTTGSGSNGVIKPKVIDLTATRVYDGTATASASLFGTLAGVNSETLTLTGSGTVSSKNVGSYTGLNFDLGGLTLADGTGSASNYTLTGGTDTLTITPAALTAAFTAQNKTYDGTNVATLTGAATLSGLIGTDAVTLVDPTVAHFSDKNAGTGKTVTGDMSISGGDAGNYTFTQGTATADINPLHITVTATGKNKQYDATTADPGTTVQSAGVIGGDTVAFGFASATFADKNVANAKTVTIDGITAGGSDGGNYVVDNPDGVTTTADITPRIINLSGMRIYDGTTAASADLFASGGDLATGFGGEHLTLAGSGTVDKNVGNGKAVTLGSLALGDDTGGSGGLASNYTLVGGSDKLTITKRPLTTTFNADDKTYDGTRTAVLENAQLVDAGGSTTSGLITGDDVSLTSPTVGTFDNKNVGTGKTVTGAMGITGVDAGNYTFTNGTALADITQAVLTVVASDSDKTYDGNTTAVVTLSGGVVGDNLTFSDTSADYDGKNAGAHDITVQGISVSGADAGNYVLGNTTATTTGTIDKVVLNLSGTRVYDGTTDADANLFGTSGVLAGVAGETIQLSGTGQMADKNVGTGKAFASLGSLVLSDGSGLAGNYTLVGGSDTLTITPRSLTVTTTPVSRDYDGTRIVALTGSVLSNLVSGDDVVLGNAGQGLFADKNVGSGKTITTAMTISGGDVGNYSFTQPTGLVANVDPLAITVAATAANKVYDATTGATLTSLGSSGVIAGDTVNFTSSSATFADANAATGKTVTVTGISKSGIDAGNYTINTTATTTANITPVVLNLVGTRVYDGTTDADASLFGTGGVLAGIAGQTLDLSGSGTLTDKNAGTKAFSSLGSLVLGDGGNGGLASNYTLVGGSDTLTITPKSITVTAAAANKVYDATTGATLTSLGSTGVIAGDTVNFTPSSATFADANAATGKTVTVTGIGKGGADAGNYIINTTATTTADITPFVLNLSGTRVYDGTTDADANLFGTSGVLAGVAGETIQLSGTGQMADKNVGTTKAFASLGSLVLSDGSGLAGNYTLVGGSDTLTITPRPLTVTTTPVSRDYDGTRIVALTGSALSNLVSGDDVVLGNAGQGLFVDKNVGSGKTITTNMTLSGSDTGNYSFTQPTGLVANVDPLAITVAATAANKVYDVTTGATLTSLGSSGVIAGDTVNFTSSGAAFGDANAADGKTVTVTGISKSGADAGNYTINTTATTTADITPVVLNLAATRVYDGTTDADASLFGTGGVLAGIAGQTLDLSGSGTLTDKNVGTAKAFANLGNLVLGDGGNGGLAQNYTLVGGSDTLTITPKSITVIAAAANKVYDATTGATLTSLGSTGVLSGDMVAFDHGTATFADANAATGKTVTVSGITDTGTDAGNYTINTTATATADITPVVLNLAGTRVYDGTIDADATLFGTGGVLAGVAGESLTLSGAGTLTDKNVGMRKPFASTAGFTLTGNDATLASNYTLVGGNDWVTITPATLMVTGTKATDRSYDGTRVDTLSGATLAGLIGSDDVVLGNATQGRFTDANAGTDKAVTTAMTIGGKDSGNYVLQQPGNLVADITPRPVTVTATGTDKMFDGNTRDAVLLAGEGVVSGDEVGFSQEAANFSDSNVGDDKTVTVTGIRLTGADAANYVLVDPVATTTASITGAQLSAFGVDDGVLAYSQGPIRPASIATPYGLVIQQGDGPFTGNRKKLHRPIERHRTRRDFTSGMALQVVDGGVRMPVRSKPGSDGRTR